MEKVRIFALGGLDEDGKNMYVVEINNEIVIIEAGIKYPGAGQLGVEKIIPDFNYIIESKNRVKGIFITHAHDDVMGALPYLLKQMDIPIYATPLNALILQNILLQNGIKSPTIKRIQRGVEFKVGNIVIDTFATTHSVGESYGLAIHSQQGLIMYTGEFIVDFDSLDEAFSSDISKIAALGNQNVLCLMTESIGAYRKGHTAPNHRIKDIIEPNFVGAKGRIIISTYSQNVYRAIEILNLAKRYKRKVVIFGNELRFMLEKVVQMGYFTIPSELIVNSKDMNQYNDEDLLVIISGSGPAIFRFMHRIAFNEDDMISFKEEDTIIIASPIVPGTEKEASNMENELYKLGAKIVTISGKSVYSMHASSEDLKMMIYLTKPKYYFPVRGEYRQLIDNATIATNMGLTPDRIIVLDNGQMADFDNGKLKSTSNSISCEDVLIDGSEELDSSGVVIKDREQLSTDGVIVVGVVLDFKTKDVVGGPDVQMRGFVYLKDADHIVSNIMRISEEVISSAIKAKRFENMGCRVEMRDKISKYVLKETGKRPMILPAIVEINL